MDNLYAVGLRMTTLVGYNYFGQPPPYPKGNCFTLVAGDLDDINILNMNYENFRVLIDAGILTYPILLEEFEPGVYYTRAANIIDNRVPKTYLLDEPCPICMPKAKK